MREFIKKSLELKNNANGSDANFVLFDINILENVEDFVWESSVRYLESKGFSVAARLNASDDFGYYIAEGLTENNCLKGWNLEDKKPIDIIVKYIGWPLRSEKPLEPSKEIKGLKVVPTHSIAVLFGSIEDGKSVWGNVEHIPHSQLSVSVMDTGAIQYAQSAFEGCCAMKNTEKKVFGFRLDKNTERFNESVQAIGLPEINEKIVQKMIEDTVIHNVDYIPNLGDGQLYIRPSVAGLTGALGIVEANKFVITVEIAALGSYLPPSIKVEGLKYVHRPYSGTSKIASNYSVPVRIKQGVKSRGFSDYLSYDIRGNVEEVSSCAVAFIDADNNFIFPPVQDEIDSIERHVLPSITRKSVIELLRFQGKNVIVRDVHASEIATMNAMFTMGNAVGVVSVSELSVKETKENAENNIASEIILFDDEASQKIIAQIKTDVFSARIGELNGFTQWAKELV